MENYINIIMIIACITLICFVMAMEVKLAKKQPNHKEEGSQTLTAYLSGATESQLLEIVKEKMSPSESFEITIRKEYVEINHKKTKGYKLMLRRDLKKALIEIIESY